MIRRGSKLRDEEKKPEIDAEIERYVTLSIVARQAL
jgi:hypothetical protein